MNGLPQVFAETAGQNVLVEFGAGFQLISLGVDVPDVLQQIDEGQFPGTQAAFVAVQTGAATLSQQAMPLCSVTKSNACDPVMLITVTATLTVAAPKQPTPAAGRSAPASP